MQLFVRETKRKINLNPNGMLYQTIFHIISNWYYFDDSNTAVNFHLEDKINKTKPTHTHNVMFKEKKIRRY